MIVEQQLARFVDRNTLVYDRRYEHPIERVWEAVTTAEQMDAWMLPETRVDARLGGACAFGWGGPADADGATPGTITVFEPPTVVQYSHPDGSFMRFELRAEGPSATALSFTLHFLPSKPGPLDEAPGGDKPAGPDTAWRPGFVAGYSEMLDDLDPFLRGEWTLADNLAELAAPENPEHDRWVEIYRDLIRDECPKETA